MLSLCFQILVADGNLGPLEAGAVGAERSGTHDCLASRFVFLHEVRPFVGHCTQTIFSKCTDLELQAQLKHKIASRPYWHLHRVQMLLNSSSGESSWSLRCRLWQRHQC